MEELRANLVCISLLVAVLLTVPSPPIPWIIGTPQTYPQGTFPIDQGLAKQYAENLISSYSALVNTKEAVQPDFASIRHFFLLYPPDAGSFKVFVARDNKSATDDMIEFLFAPNATANLQVNVYTNNTGAGLRPEPIVINQPTSLKFDQDDTRFGVILSHVTTQSPVGVAYFPLIWITHLDQVYNGTSVNSANAAQVIYANDQADENEVLNPPFPSQRWFVNVLSTPLWQFVVAIGVVLGILGTIAYFYREGMLPHFKPSSKRYS